MRRNSFSDQPFGFFKWCKLKTANKDTSIHLNIQSNFLGFFNMLKIVGLVTDDIACLRLQF